MYGNNTMFLPRWMPGFAATDPHYFRPNRWTYVYDHSRLASTLERYVDYDKLKPGQAQTRA
jgi:NTE family protein